MPDEASEGYELRADDVLAAPRASTWRCWTDAELLERWFHPESWTTEVKALELYPGGASHLVMRGPNGEVSDGVGVFLEVVPERRLVFTNAYTSGWIPSQKPAGTPFRTMIIGLSNEGDKTRYVVRALHWTSEAKQEHEQAGFQRGWDQTTRQLEALARSL